MKGAFRTPQFDLGQGSLILPVPRNEVGIDDQRVRFQGKAFQPKTDLHITLIGKRLGKRILDAQAVSPELESDVRDAVGRIDWSFQLTDKYFHVAEDRKKGGAGQGTLTIPAESIIQLVDLPGITTFYQWLNQRLGAGRLTAPPIHLTLYTYAWPNGICLADADEFARLVTGPVDPAGLERMPPGGYNDRYEQALRLVASVHGRQMRKCSDIPYVTHLVQVAGILAYYGFGTDVTIAALLHDIVEDHGYPLEDIFNQFGPEVATIVADLSEHKLDEHGRLRPWEVRKREALESIRFSGLDSLVVKVADSLHNVRGLVLDLGQQGPLALTCFKRGPKALLANYEEILAIAQQRLPGHPLVAEYAEAMALFKAVLADVLD